MFRQNSRRYQLAFALFTVIGGSALAADSTVPRRVTFSAASTGVRRYTPGRWSAIQIQAANQSDSDATGTMSVYFGKDDKHQFARKLWVPKNSSRITWLPVRAPIEFDPKRWSFDMSILDLEESARGEVLKHRKGEPSVQSQPLLAANELIKTAAIFRKPLPDENGMIADPDDDAYEMMAIARETTDFSRVIMSMSDDFVPPHPIMWETLDQLILCGDRIVGDSAGLAVIRDWLFRGGRMCVFLDRTSPETVAAILGSTPSFQVVDRVELDEFTIEDLTQPTGHNSIDKRRFETPVDFVRVVAEDADVHCRVKGWPAAFWRKFGDGEVLFLTLAPNGWRFSEILPGRESLIQNTDPSYRDHIAIRSVAARFFKPRVIEPTVEPGIHPVLQEKIGYNIPSRRLATSLLGANGLALILSGVWLSRRKQLDRMAVVLPVLAGTTTVVFLVIGALNNYSVPSSVAVAQVIRFAPDTDSANISGAVAMYQQATSDLRVAGGADGLLLPATSASDDTIRRLLWTDSDSGYWTEVSLPAGSVQFAAFNQRIQLPEHTCAIGQFGPEGFVGKLTAPSTPNVGDPVIASLPAASTALRMQEDGSFVVKPSDVLASNQFLSETVVSDESRRRQDVYRNLLQTRAGSRFATQPTLFYWTKPRAGVLNVPSDLSQQATALAVIPLSIERTPPASDFSVPATFIRTESVHGAKGKSLAFNERTGTWISDSSRATNTRLRFVLPQQVLPCKLSSAQLIIKLSAPSRELHVHAVVDNKDELIRPIPNPNGVYSIPVNRPEWLAVDEGGGVRFSLVITEAALERADRQVGTEQKNDTPQESSSPGNQAETSSNRRGSFETWGIDYVRLDVRGKTL